ncbi:MAG: aldo/keto reductase [Spirochaeta sp.]|jgi:myo-inositol catabolism protein IolS|nr:aldo/keto reductase [Spirochaeta sp.]
MLDGIGFGTWALGGTDWGPISARDARRLLETARGLGFRHFDTAESYGNGRAEQLVGQTFRAAFKTDRDQFFIASKSVVRDPRSQGVHLERSLRRCGCEYFDRYYIHWPREGISLPRAVETLDRYRRAGSIGEIGLSNVSVAEYRAAAAVAPVAAVQFGYNALWRVPERQGLTTLDGARRVAYSALAQGLLARRFATDPRWDSADDRPRTPLFSEPLWDTVRRFNGDYLSLCAEYGVHPAAAALGWLRGGTGRVDEALVGGRTPDHLTALVSGMWALAASEELRTAVDQAITALSDAIQPVLPDLPNMFGYVPRPCRNC